MSLVVGSPQAYNIYSLFPAVNNCYILTASDLISTIRTVGYPITSVVWWKAKTVRAFEVTRITVYRSCTAYSTLKNPTTFTIFYLNQNMHQEQTILDKCLPQSASSAPSLQSSLPSHRWNEGMHRWSGHENCAGLHVASWPLRKCILN